MGRWKWIDELHRDCQNAIKNARVYWKGMKRFAGSIMHHCNTDGNGYLDYDEIKTCLSDFGLSDDQMNQAKWGMVPFASLTYKGLVKTVNETHAWAQEHMHQ